MFRAAVERVRGGPGGASRGADLEAVLFGPEAGRGGRDGVHAAGAVRGGVGAGGAVAGVGGAAGGGGGAQRGGVRAACVAGVLALEEAAAGGGDARGG